MKLNIDEKSIITIDGPAGSGKSTIAKSLAKTIEGKRLDTGAIYRSFGFSIIKNNIDLNDENKLFEHGINLNLKMETNGEIFLNGEEISKLIRTTQISQMASKIAIIPKVREALMDIQRRLAKNGPTVCEGRDMGTIVFPGAQYKFFLTASAETRAKRRYLELKEKGEDVSYEHILSEQKERDERDSNRDIAPLKPAKDAINIDSTEMSIQDVVNFIVNRIK